VRAAPWCRGAVVCGLVAAAPAAWGGAAQAAEPASAVANDFDGDGRGDLAVGVPGARVGGAPRAGAVVVQYSRADLPAVRLAQGARGLPGHAEAYDGFGRTVAGGDFDGDGYADLAVAAPFEDVSGEYDAGSVHVLYGSRSGLRAGGVFTQDTAGVPGPASSTSWFGEALAAGDADGDGRDELAVGAPKQRVDDGSGRVVVVPGGARGLVPGRASGWTQATKGVRGVPELYDCFGSALAFGDTDGDSRADLVVGVPGENAVQVLPGSASGTAPSLARPLNGPAGSSGWGGSLVSGDLDGNGRADVVGRVTEVVSAGDDSEYDVSSLVVLRAGAEGLRQSGVSLLRARDPRVPGPSGRGDESFQGLDLGDVDGDGYDDLVAGVVSATSSAPGEEAVVHVRGSASGLVATGGSRLAQSSPGIPGSAEPGDAFGSAVAAYDRDADGCADLAIGAPYEDVDGRADAGRVTLVPGSADGPQASGTVVSTSSLGLRGSAHQEFGRTVGPGGTRADD